MKIKLLLLFTILCSSRAFSKADSTEALFKDVKFSWFNIDLGYTCHLINGQPLNGYHFHYGIVLSKTFSAGFGMESVSAKDLRLTNYPYYFNTRFNYLISSIDLEYLFRPEKLINFSIPLKVAYGGARYSAISTNNPSLPGGFITGTNFFVLAPGLQVYLNVFKGMSLGAGGYYRFASGVENIGSNSEMSGPSFIAQLRFKLATEEQRKRQLERHKQYMQNLYQNR